MKVNFKYVGHTDSKYIPQHATSGASGCDLSNASGEMVIIPGGESRKIPTGICVEIPEGYEGQLRPRSGLATKKQLMMLPSVGTIDADYRGEVGVTYFNLNKYDVVIQKDERIAQLVIAPYANCEYNEKDELTDTVRGSGGYGSTGK